MQGQARMSLADYKGAAAAYVKALELAPSLSALADLATAYTDDGQYQSALDAIKSANEKLTSTPKEFASLGYGKPELELLLGRTYAQWPGHDSQAMQYYDQLIASRPDDFRQALMWHMCAMRSNTFQHKEVQMYVKGFGQFVAHAFKYNTLQRFANVCQNFCAFRGTCIQVPYGMQDFNGRAKSNMIQSQT